jgi:guanylate kinase
MQAKDIKRRGLMLVISAPSGTGKTSLTNRLIKEDGHIERSVSVTTRPPRGHEEHGKDYLFVSDEEFEGMVANNALLEHATIYGYKYGTPKQRIIDLLQKGQDLVLDIDWQGAGQLINKANEDLASVFLLPPSMDELNRRLTKRGENSPQDIKMRIEEAYHEVMHFDQYDYVVINDDFDKTFDKLVHILRAERLRRRRRPGIEQFVKELISKMEYKSE